MRPRFIPLRAALCISCVAHTAVISLAFALPTASQPVAVSEEETFTMDIKWRFAAASETVTEEPRVDAVLAPAQPPSEPKDVAVEPPPPDPEQVPIEEPPPPSPLPERVAQEDKKETPTQEPARTEPPETTPLPPEPAPLPEPAAPAKEAKETTAPEPAGPPDAHARGVPGSRLASARDRAATPEPTLPADAAQPKATAPEKKGSGPAPVAPTSRVITAVAGENPPPAYPPLARRSGWQGTVLLRVEVDGAGRVTHCRVLEGSGHDVLDRAALAAVRRWRFHGGPGVVEVPFEFVLR